MKQSLTEKQEIQIRKTVGQWRKRQAMIGNIFLFLCLASFISFALFLSDPGKGTAWLLFVSLTLMVISGGSLFGSAYVVVQHQQLLQSPESSTPASESRATQTSPLDIIDAEVVGPSFEQAAG